MSNPGLVSIGIPVHNSQNTIWKCIDSAVKQDYLNIEIIISDNSSTDETSNICRQFALIDSRIKYFRQEQNIGAVANFHFVLEKANGEFFRWLAADDLITNDSISESLILLKGNLDFVACASPTLFDYEISRNIEAITFDLMGCQVSRIRNFFKKPGRSHGLYYSLVRRDVLDNYPFFKRDFFAFDWCLILFLLSQGPIATGKSSLLTLGSNGASSKSSIYSDYGLVGIRRLFPFTELIRHLIKLGHYWEPIPRIFLSMRVVTFILKDFVLEFRRVRYKISYLRKLVVSKFV